MCKVGEILETKGSKVHSVGPDTRVQDALLSMAKFDIGVVLVTENDEVRGIFSERDFARNLLRVGDCCLEAPVSDLMISPVYFVTPDQSINDCMAVMSAKNIRHLPVLDEGRLVGLVSMKDIVETLLKEKDEQIGNLEHLVWVNLV
jgi:CBS domain-containing protein